MSCPGPEDWVAYWAGEADHLEEHLFSCASCTELAARVGAVTEAVRGLLPPVVTTAMVETLRARGLRVEDNLVEAGRPSHVTFDRQDLIIHHLRGLALEDAAEVALIARVAETGVVLVEVPSAPFDPGAGEVLIACQRHYRAFPPNVDFEVTVTPRAGEPRTTSFRVTHEFV